MKFKKLTPPLDGEKIEVKDGRLQVPDNPIIVWIEGDGTGPDIWRATHPVLNTAVELAYGGKRRIAWMEAYAGEKAQAIYNELLPEDTFKAIEEFIVAIKGPLTTPVGTGFRSLNVTLRQVLDLYACVRPAKWYEGVPSPMSHPEKVNMVVFREATEDLYAGIEWEKGSPEALKFIELLKKEFGIEIRHDSGIGIKPISEFATKRLVRKAIQYAIDNKLPSVTFMHKGNIMKFTEGAFMKWGYEVALREFRDYVVTEQELVEQYGGKAPEGKIVVKDRIADNMFQQIQTRPDEYHVIATMNVNGDYISDALAAMVGGLGMAPSANMGDYIALFEATHGSAPKYAGKDVVNPSSVILSGVMMLRYIGWHEAAELVEKGISETIKQKKVTYDLARHIGVEPIKCSEFGQAVCENMKEIAKRL
ncbi:MAG: isocitrate dehydrogenase (NADP(+)) [Armatimonadetes bacterium]|nr:isocitrate dehydrogenase (NADP(+)) [Armatimonadota bacterium]MDW8027291.1 isocitrate dehydrogenase (NADP(+)) [Armatimonadota bacterium]